MIFEHSKNMPLFDFAKHDLNTLELLRRSLLRALLFRRTVLVVAVLIGVALTTSARGSRRAHALRLQGNVESDGFPLSEYGPTGCHASANTVGDSYDQVEFRDSAGNLLKVVRLTKTALVTWRDPAPE